MLLAKRLQLQGSALAAPAPVCLEGLDDVFGTLPFCFKATPVALDAAIGHIHQVLGNANSNAVF